MLYKLYNHEGRCVATSSKMTEIIQSATTHGYFSEGAIHVFKFPNYDISIEQIPVFKQVEFDRRTKAMETLIVFGVK